MSAPRVCVGVVVGVHGVRGAVRVKSFTEVAVDIGRYGPVESEDGRHRFRLAVIGEAKGAVVATLDGIGDRDAAQALKGVRLFVTRDRLPATAEDEFLCADLLGLMVETPDGVRLGTVTAANDFGAGDVIDIALDGGGSLMVPFTRADVPEVDVAGGRLVVVPPVYAAQDGPDGEGDEHAV